MQTKMLTNAIVAVLLQIVLSNVYGAVAPQVYYVQPTEPLSTMANSCEQANNETCHTLSYYARFHNFTSETSFVFLSGNHSLSGETLTLVNVTNITLIGRSLVNIISTSRVTVYCESVDNLTIEGLNFYVDVPDAGSATNAVLRILSATRVSINHSKFYGTAKSIVLVESQANISSSTFQKSKHGLFT